MVVKVIDYKLGLNTWQYEEYQAVNRVIQSGMFTCGDEVRAFEDRMAAHHNVRYAVMVNSGSSANLLATAVFAERNPLTEFVVPAISWSTTYTPLMQRGYKMHFVDVDGTLNMDPNWVNEVFNDQTALMTVNLLGNSCDYDRLPPVAIEDNCESFYGSYNKQMLGTFGDMGTLSFFFSHHLQTMEGGMILTDDEVNYHYLLSLRSHGWVRDLPSRNHVRNRNIGDFQDPFTFATEGFCVRPLEVSGAVGREQLKRARGFHQIRVANSVTFLDRFGDVDWCDVQRVTPNSESSWFGFAIILKGDLEGRRTSVTNLLHRHGVECRPVVTGNFIRQPVMAKYDNWTTTPTPEADYVHNNGFFIGNHPTDLKDKIEAVADLIEETFNV